MFEKEAEEWVKKEFPLLEVEHTNLEESITEYRAYKDGAELGYNKANERLIKAKELIGELISSLSVVGECEEEECELLNRAEAFISEVEK